MDNLRVCPRVCVNLGADSLIVLTALVQSKHAANASQGQ